MRTERLGTQDASRANKAAEMCGILALLLTDCAKTVLKLRPPKRVSVRYHKYTVRFVRFELCKNNEASFQNRTASRNALSERNLY